MSADSTGADANAGSSDAPISADGQLVLFRSDASDPSPGTAMRPGLSCATAATLWANYGDGFAGTNGVPSFTSRTDPVLGTTVTLDLANSSGSSTFGLLFVGFARTKLHSRLGGDLLVVPSIAVSVSIPVNGTSFSGNLPNDDSLCGFEIDLQAFEADSGAVKGVSFTPGLELVLGR